MRRPWFTYRIFIFIAGLFLVLYFHWYQPFFSLVGVITSKSVNLATQGFGSLVSVFTREDKCDIACDNLNKEVARLQSENIRLQELQNENVALRKELNFVETLNFPTLIGRIIGTTKENGVSFFVIQHEHTTKIQIGAPVVSEGALIGKIVKSGETISMAAPITAPTIKIGASLPGLTQTIGVVEGQLNTELVVQLIPKNIIIEPGASIITSGLNEFIPRGLLIGIVERVEKDDRNLFQTAYLRPILTPGATSIVSILTLENLNKE